MRCAIYTRKSTEHGIELEFNSLHAQREACEAYIKSQAHEGWYAIVGVISSISVTAKLKNAIMKGGNFSLSQIAVNDKLSCLTEIICSHANSA